MSKVYIVKASGGEFDDAWELNLSAYLDRTAAELEVLRLQEQTKRILAMFGDVDECYHQHARSQDFAPEEVPKVPKGPSKSTKESMAAHHAAMSAWREVAKPIIERNDMNRQAAMDAAREAAKQKAIDLGAIEDDLKVMGFESGRFSPSCRSADASYEIEELELR